MRIIQNAPILTPEQIAKKYYMAMYSVNLINRIAAQAHITQADVDTVNLNIAHLTIMLSKTFWTTEDLTPLKNAVKVVVVVK